PFRPLLMGPEHTLEPRQITAHNLANRVVVVPRHLTGKSFDVHWKTVLSQNMTKQDRETVRLLLRGFPLSITHQSSSKASSIRRRRSFAGASIFLYFRKNAMSSASSSFSPSPASRYSTVVSSAVAIRASFSAEGRATSLFSTSRLSLLLDPPRSASASKVSPRFSLSPRTRSPKGVGTSVLLLFHRVRYRDTSSP